MYGVQGGDVLLEKEMTDRCFESGMRLTGQGEGERGGNRVGGNGWPRGRTARIGHRNGIYNGRMGMITSENNCQESTNLCQCQMKTDSSMPLLSLLHKS